MIFGDNVINKQVARKIDKDEATKKLEELLIQEIVSKENILNEQVNVYKNEEYIEVEVIYEVLENIGIKASAKASAAGYHDITCGLDFSATQKVFLRDIFGTGGEYFRYGMGDIV